MSGTSATFAKIGEIVGCWEGKQEGWQTEVGWVVGRVRGSS